jgi:hypothetical protein
MECEEITHFENNRESQEIGIERDEAVVLLAYGECSSEASCDH